MPILGNQIRAARALIGMEQVELADKAGVSANTVRNMEAFGDQPVRVRTDTLDAIRAAFSNAGVVLLEEGQMSADGYGVRLKEIR